MRDLLTDTAKTLAVVIAVGVLAGFVAGILAHGFETYDSRK